MASKANFGQTITELEARANNHSIHEIQQAKLWLT